MVFQHKKLFSVLALAGVLSACGGNDTTVDNTSNNEPKLSKYSGIVLNENEAPISGLPIVLENRITDQTFEAITDDNGNFSVLVNPGTYDVLFDDKDATNYTSLQLLAIDLQTDAEGNVHLQSAQTLPDNQLTGTAKNTKGAPEAGRKLFILPSIAHAPATVGTAEVPAPFIVQTDAQGHFSQTLGRTGMDFEFDVLVLTPNAPELDTRPLASGYVFASEEAEAAYQKKLQDYLATYVEESVDIEKTDGAMHINLTLGSSVRNLRDATGTPSVVPADAQQLAEQETAVSTTASLQSTLLAIRKNAQSAVLGIIPSAQAGSLISQFVVTLGKTEKKWYAASRPIINFTQGKINESPECKLVSMKDIYQKDNTNFSDIGTFIMRTIDGTEFCIKPRKKTFFNRDNHEIKIITAAPGNIEIKDEANGSHMINTRMNYLSVSEDYNPKRRTYYFTYKSDKPSITAIKFIP